MGINSEAGSLAEVKKLQDYKVLFKDEEAKDFIENTYRKN